MKTQPIPAGIAAALACMAVISSLSATPVTVADPSFEVNTGYGTSNQLGPSNYHYNLAPDWTGTNGPSNGAAFEEYITGFAADGTDHLGMENNYAVWQDLVTIYQANTRYTLTIAAGNRSGITTTGNQTRYLLADTTGTIHATGIFDASTVIAQTFADAPALVFDTSNSPAAVGRPIRILLQSGGNGRSHFDNIRLDAVPLIPPGAATLENLTATEVGATIATLGGTVADIGNDAPALTVFWGTTNGGVNAAAWEHSTDLPGTHTGNFSTSVGSLTPDTTCYFTVRATNSAGVSWALATGSFETLPLPPTVSNGPATGIHPTTASVAATVTSMSPAALTIYHGPVDGGTNPAAWAASASQAGVSGGATIDLTGLTHDTTYYYRAFAGNAGGSAWAAESLTFHTPAVALSTVENRSAEGITGTTANLRGEVTDDGNDTPGVTIFFGPADGGTTPTAWTGSINLGTRSGEFSGFVAGLAAETTYHFRCRATNAAGTAWAPESSTFTTTAIIPKTAVINEFHYKPADPTSREEFIELHNPGDTTIDLSGWTLSDAVTYTFPSGTSLAAGAYLVVAENPATIVTKFGKTALGPWSGNLNSSGERIDLRDASNTLQDRVSYSVGFPWPTRADGAGNSAELVHPSLDNDLGGSWRSSGFATTEPVPYSVISPSATGWRFRKGSSEASTPVDAWRQVAFNDTADGTWFTGQAPVGMGSGIGANTPLTDMVSGTKSNYKTVYARKTFTIPTGQIPDKLTLKIRIDDGAVVWINGTEVHRTSNAGTGQLAYSAAASSGITGAPTWTTINLTNASAYLFGGTNVLAIHGLNRDNNNHRNDFCIDAELTATPPSPSPTPTPGAANSIAESANHVPPQIRQVTHTPVKPVPGQAVTITARITDPDGMGVVNLSYQPVDPGSYIRLGDASYATTWTSVPMNDSGTAGDVTAGDSVFTAVLPASVQTNRRLVRYRITPADTAGNQVTVPYADDEQPNFAYYVYSGIPDWQGAFRPGSTPLQTIPATVLDDVPVYSLIANGTDVINSQYNGGYDGVRFRGTFVYDGVVYDHIQYKNRGEASTYQSGKNKWRFFFNRSRDLPAKNNFGEDYAETWGSFSGDACASPWAPLHRGMAGVEEALSYKVFQLAGQPSSNTHYYHFRVVRGATEAPDPAATVSDPIGTTYGQYAGDFWGLYLAVEQPDGSFLDERGLPDGSVYKIEGNAGDKKSQGATQPTDSSDWNTFRDAHVNASPGEAWWRANMDMNAYYTFHALNRLIGNVDVRGGYNHYFYHRSTDNRWVPIPWDLDMMYIAKNHWTTSINGTAYPGTIHAHRAILEQPALALEYRNRAREILSLMASDPNPGGGQIGQLIDEFAQIVNPSGVALTLSDADAAMWNLHPRTAGSDSNASGQGNHKGNFWRTSFADSRIGGDWTRWLRSPTSSGTMEHEDSMAYLRDYSTNTWPGGTWTQNNGNQLGYGYQFLASEAADADAPAKPVLVSTGPPGFPVNSLTFSSSAFGDPQGSGTHAASQWRVAEIQGPGVTGWTQGTPRKYEINAVLDTGAVGTGATWSIPLGAVEPGRTYRVRVRHRDSSGRWSYWSEPAQFTATPAPLTLIHYWNFNDASPASDLLVPTQTAGGGTLAVVGAYESGTGQSFAAANARLENAASSHLRINNPLTSGTAATLNLPTTGFSDIVVKYETRRSGQGAGNQTVEYSTNGSTWNSFTTLTVVDGTPVVANLDFRAITAANDNPNFRLRITFAQGAGGTSGNNRFDNLTVEGASLTAEPILIPNGNSAWNFAENWTSNTIPDGTGMDAVIPAPGGTGRDVTIATPVTVGSLEFRNAGSGYRNRLTGAGLTFDGGATPAILEVTGAGSGFAELDVEGGTHLTTDLRIDVSNTGGDPLYGALRLRGAWSGSGGLIKQGPGCASLTGDLKTFTGPVRVEQGVLRFTESATPSATSGVSVLEGGQLRLTASSTAGEERLYTFGGPLQLAGSGRGAEIPDSEHNGVLGALRYDPENGGVNLARVVNDIQFTANADVHVDGPENTLVLSGALTGPGGISKTGGGSLVITGNSPAYAGNLGILNGPVVINGNAPGLAVAVGPGQNLSGSGTVASVSGTGTVAPHPGILTAGFSTAADFDFVMAHTGSPGNSLLRLIDPDPLPSAPATIDLFINRATRTVGEHFTGGVFCPASCDLAAALAGTQVRILVPDAAGTVIHQGVAYRPGGPSDNLSWSVVSRSIDFGGGPVTGNVMEVTVGGAPSAYAQWRSLCFANPADFANNALSGPGADPSGTGVSNLMRYALGAGPHEPVAHLLPKPDTSGSGTSFMFRYDPSKPDLVWRVRATNDLSEWPSVVFDSSTSPIPPLENGWLRVNFPTSLGTGPGTDARLFMRLEVVLTQP